jgi:TolB protein
MHARRLNGLKVAMPAILTLLFVLALLRPALAQTEIDITGGRINPLPIAIARFRRAGAEEAAATVTRSCPTIWRFGLFQSAAARILHRNRSPVSSKSRASPTGGRFRPGAGHRPGVPGGDKIRAEFRLWDVNSRSSSPPSTTTSARTCAIGHLMSDIVYKSLTGIDGFDTRIVFVDTSQDQQVKKLAIADQTASIAQPDG